MDARLYWIWMQRALPLGSSKADRLLREFGHAKAVYEAARQDFAVLNDTDGMEDLSGEQLDSLCDKSLDAAQRIFSKAMTGGGWILTPEDRLYPSLLRAIPGLPLVLYGRGEMPDLDVLPSIGIVGTREVTGYGKRATALLAGGLALGGVVVISGGARGADAIAHEAALAAGGQTVAVQGCGLNVSYPPQNADMRDRIAKAGAVITEFPPDTQPLRHHFPLRNRLISGLSLGICVTEAPERSGALITATHAFEQGRDVFAVAGDMLSGRSPGTDELIRQGARLVTGAVEILEEYRPRFPDSIHPKAASRIRLDQRFNTESMDVRGKPAVRAHQPSTLPKTPELSPASVACPDGVSPEARTLHGLLNEGPRKLEELIVRSGLSAAQVMTALTELELFGAVQSVPGRGYALSSRF